MLDPITPQYIDDLVSWAAIGARTIESQTHRQMASGLSMPVGYKNNTDGNLRPAVEAFLAALEPHRFLGIDDEGRTSVVVTRGNPRGPSHPARRPRSARTSIPSGSRRRPRSSSARACRRGSSSTAATPTRASSHERQQVVWSSVIEQRASAATWRWSAPCSRAICSRAGRSCRRTPASLRYGVSITDACIGWDETERLLRDAWRRLEPEKETP